MKNKKPKQPEVPTQPPVIVATPRIAHQRMTAISDLCRAICKLANALDAPVANIEISHCNFVGGSEGSSCIEVKPEAF